MSAPKPSENKASASGSAAGTASGSGGSQSGSSANPHPAQLLETYRKRAETAEKERDDFKSLAQRLQADFENYQKRAQREANQERRYSHASLASDFLPILDNFDRAMQAAKQAGETSPLVQGVTMIQMQLLDILKRHGISLIESQGMPFDPNVHQAVSQQPSADQAPNTILHVLEQGFMLHDRVLRPARVVVATAPVVGQNPATISAQNQATDEGAN